MEVIAGVDLSGKRAIVTGAASGLGVETVRALALAGAEVTLAVRAVESGERVADEIRECTGNPHLSVGSLDLADQASVAAFVAGWGGPLHILVNNAGVMATPERRTEEGWELQSRPTISVTSILATGVRDALAAAGGGRVVVVSSVGHVNGEVMLMTSTSSTVRTNRGRRMRSPRPRTSCSWSRRADAGPPITSRSTR